MSKKLLALLVPIWLLGCQEASDKPTQLLYTVESKPFSITVDAEGELEAASETVISAPTSARGAQTLAWIVPEYSQVKKGDVIARFDGSQLARRKRFSEFDKGKVAQDMTVTDSDLTTRKSHLDSDKSIVSEEKRFAETFSIDDERIRSKLDILDQLQNVEYLNAKEAYFEWQTDQFSSSALGEMELLKLQSKQHESKIAMYNANLESLEVIAPHDGLLTLNADWRGEKPKAGQALWPGQKIGGLPDISSLQAKLFVHEKEALGLEVGQTVKFTLLSNSDERFDGKVTKVSPYPQSIRRGDPQKYYEVIASLNETPSHFTPGNKVLATLLVQERKQALLVPKHSIINDNNAFFVLVKDGSQFQRVKVELGQSNLSHTEVLEGLSPNQQIALVANKEL
ncbi:HlyD family efflux transporter periplasmic adaptor subunit [Pseudoalteromonas sp. McH1-7]|uniref:efflux RND transporter periplasmic adaptor subunit n=1 Tax=unclassified Pseudoalteromonas TaxID=194690 RepID=UPI001591ECB6|nr:MULTISPECIES: HlyD family efflux transporter periplasmic adaptor subunit [unclassified Pseudoalteromonas]NUZ09926.1 HlyD family efflux transporter periplasmic adaptor subunit [Pseudoalteromonas sp. McH1-7]USD31004.1 HlyD family efflux transporter periplasmic adaptor subunit [Pseudoalteromonas sp. SCSIO 43201]